MYEQDNYNGRSITLDTAMTLIDLIKEDKRNNPEKYEETEGENK